MTPQSEIPHFIWTRQVRGIENPNPRTCLVQIKCGAADWGVMTVAVAYLIFELCVRGGVIG